MKPKYRRKFPKVSVQLGALLPMVEECAAVEGEKKILTPDRSTVIRECLEEGLMKRIAKFAPADRQRILKAGASTAA